jgi:hypothetical protein
MALASTAPTELALDGKAAGMEEVAVEGVDVEGVDVEGVETAAFGSAGMEKDAMERAAQPSWRTLDPADRRCQDSTCQQERQRR